jgi:hypothetical protein
MLTIPNSQLRELPNRVHPLPKIVRKFFFKNKKKTLASESEMCIIRTQMNGNCADERRGRESTTKKG